MAVALAAGTRLGRYEIVGPLGKGGMGVVYRARDTRLGRDVALKIVTERHAGEPVALARFEREARAVAALSHPNILAIYDVGEDRGISFAVTELLDGETLRGRLGRSPLPMNRLLEIANGLAAGLAAAHARGILHRDLKPDNIFLTTDGNVKILDFGLARQQPVAGEGGATQVTTETATGAVAGTPGYMSPEQLRGETLDARTDIFSLGCVLYEMASGQRAFDRANTGETLAAILRDEPDLLHIPPNLSPIIARCLEKDRTRRIQSAEDLAVALRVAAAQKTQGGRYPRRTLAIAAAVLLTAVIAASAYWLLFTRRIDSLAVLPFINASSNPDADHLVEGITESLITSLSRIPDLRVKSRDCVSRYKRAETGPEEAGRELGVRAVVQGRLLLTGDTATISAELIDAGDGSIIWREQHRRPLRDMLSVQEEMSRRISEKLRPTLTREESKRFAKAQTASPEAYQHYLMGRYRWNRRTESTLRSAADCFQQAIEIDPNFAQAWAALADVHNLLGTYGVRAPAESYPRAAVAANRALRLEPGLAEAHASLGWAKFEYEWDWSGAEREFRRAIELNPEYATAHHWYSWYLVTVGRLREAVLSIERARSLDPVSPVIHSRVGLFLYYEGSYQQAIEESRKSIDMDPTFAWGHTGLGSVYLLTGRVEDGVAELEKALTLAERGVIEMGYLGHAYAVAGRKSEARKLLAEFQDLSAKRFVPSIFRAFIHVGLGEKDQAFAWLEKAHADRGFSCFIADRRLDPVRQDPRFKEWLRRMGLPSPQ